MGLNSEQDQFNIEQARLSYGEQIIRGTNLPPEDVEDFLSLDGDLERARQWLAFAYAERDPQSDSDVIRGLLIYLCSHSTEGVDRIKREWLLRRIEAGLIKFADLTMEALMGTHLTWTHVFSLVGKEFNPTREKERVRRIYERLTAQDAASG